MWYNDYVDGLDRHQKPYKLPLVSCQSQETRGVLFEDRMRKIIVSTDWLLGKADIAPNGCWVWHGHKNEKGYGIAWVGKSPRRQKRVHRLMWELTFGPIPLGIDICHHCDNPGCINPDHLFAGTNADNQKDMDRKGRRVNPPRMTGENHPAHKLNWEKVNKIRKLYLLGYKQKYLSQTFDISIPVISKIVRGESWNLKC